MNWLWLSLLVLVVGCSLSGTGPQAFDAGPQARRLCRETLLLDTHIDLPYRLHEHWEEVSRRTETGEFDFERARRGGLNAAFLAIYVPASYGESEALELAETEIGLVEKLAADHPAQCVIGRNADDIEAGFKEGRLVLALGLENGSPIGADPGRLAYFYQRGIRYITLTHALNNPLSDSSFDSSRRWHGLSPLGREVVREMNRLGIMVDVSHVSDEAFEQILEISRTPVLATHSSCRHFTPGWERNLSDEMIRALAERGGVVQINFGSMFITEAYQKASARLFAHLGQLMERDGLAQNSPEIRAAGRQWMQAHPLPRVTVADVADHIDHVVGLVGIDHVGLGSDFDGVEGHLPEGLRDVSEYPNLIQELLSRGYSAADIRKICAENALRVWRAVEAFGSESQNG